MCARKEIKVPSPLRKPDFWKRIQNRVFSHRKILRVFLFQNIYNFLKKSLSFKEVMAETLFTLRHVFEEFSKGRGRIRPHIGPLTFLEIFLLEMVYSGRSQHSEPSYAILYYWG